MRLFSFIFDAGWFLRVMAMVVAANLLGPALEGQEPLLWADQVSETRVFPEPLVWIGERAPGEVESKALFDLVSRLREQLRSPSVLRTSVTNGDSVVTTVRRAPVDYELLEPFIATWPDSSWTPCLRANLGKYYREQGRYTLALEHWKNAWAVAKSVAGPGKHVADFTLAHWASLLASLGRVEDLRDLFAETRNRPLDGGYLQHLFDAVKEGYQGMLVHPGSSFQCGTYALNQIGQALRRSNFVSGNGLESASVKLLTVPSPTNGFTLKALSELSDEYGLNLLALKCPGLVPDHGKSQIANLVVPSVVHWRQNHYAAIIAEQGGLYRVVDQTFGEPKWLSREAIDAEASGYFLVPR